MLVEPLLGSRPRPAGAVRCPACSGAKTMTVRPGLRLPRPAMASAKPVRSCSGSAVPWLRTLCPDSAANTVTVDCPAANPRDTWSGSHGLDASSSAKQSEYFPDQPWVDLSSTPGRQSRQFSSTSRSDRPMVALARNPGPKRFAFALRPRRSRIGPLTITISAAPPVLVAGPWSMKAGSPIACSAAPDDRKVLGPAPGHDRVDRRLVRGHRAVAHRLVEQHVVGLPRPGREHRATSASVGGTTGRPSVQPLA